MTTPDRPWTFPTGSSDLGVRLARQLGVSPLVADMMVGRGIQDEPAARTFLSPGKTQLLDPFLFPAMDEACARVHKAVKAQEPIVVYGDYDVDGMTAATLLYWVLKKLGAVAEIFIPDRASEGYGLNCGAIQMLKDKGITLLITVDNGVSAAREIAFAASIGVSVIVTDHHTLPEVLPTDAILLHPRIPGREYPFPHLCGAGVAFKFGLALLASSSLPEREAVRARFAQNCLDIVAIGTVADMVPLVGENRVLVCEGLKQLSHTEHPGLRALLGLERLVGQKLTVDHIGFKVCPKINSAGRIDDHRVALQLMMARDPATASRLALQISKINHERIRLVTELMQRAQAMAETWADRAFPVVVLQTDKKGLVGLVAQRLKDQYHKPFLVLASDGATATGSGRSVDGFDLCSALTRQGERLMRFGGHAMAVGFTIACEQIPGFADAVDAAARDQLISTPPTPPIEVDAVIPGDAINELTMKDLELLAPFGQGNPAPLLAMRQVSVSRAERVGDGKHVRLLFSSLPRSVRNIGFNMTETVEAALKTTSVLDLAFYLENDNWNGRENLQMRLQAVRPAL